ncbi:MAG: asparagine--tRNA ligase, partial [Deltaproteobacteria bacterium]
EDFFVYIVQDILKHRRKELEALGRDIGRLEKVAKPFPRITYDEAVEILRQRGVDFQWGNDFGGGDETVLAQAFDRPFFVHRYPAAIKAFYMKPDPQDASRSLSVDMLAPEGYGELIGGGQREDDLDALLARIEEHGLPKEAFAWYLDLRRYGSFPHSGFGMGLERCVAYLCGLSHVREAIPFPRMLDRLSP